MNIHEYQARQLLREYGVPVKPDFAVTAASEVEQKLGALPGPPWIVKAQAHTGGRGARPAASSWPNQRTRRSSMPQPYWA